MQPDLYKRNLLIPFLKMVVDGIAVGAAVMFSYYLRFYSPLTMLFPVTKGYPSLSGYFYFSLFLTALFVITFGVFNAYRSRFFSTFSQDIPVVLKGCVLGILLAMSGAFLYRDFSYSRLVFLLIYLNSNLFLLMGRLVFHRFKARFIRRGFSVLRVALVGTSDNIRKVYPRLLGSPSIQFDFTGYYADQPGAQIDLPCLGSVSDLGKGIIAGDTLDGLVIAFDQADHQKIWRILDAAEGHNLEIFYIPDILDILTARFHTLEVGGMPLLQLKAFVLSGWQGLLKRTFDILFSVAALLLLSPFWLLIAVVIKLTSSGPIFYRQKRVSLDGHEFVMIKFRSMRSDAETDSGPVWAQKDDPRVTGIGRFLRRSSLDELPQLINVIKGEMSLVGPRPERQHFVEQFRKAVPKYLERHRVRCGMTGWAQVNGLRGQSSIEDRTRYDLYYIENWSLWFDIKIIVMTIAEVLRGENAY